MFEIIPVVSSTIKSIGYQEETENIKSQLMVIFAGGARWIYAGVPREVWERFKEAESAGWFFAREIKPHFLGKKQ